MRVMRLTALVTMCCVTAAMAQTNLTYTVSSDDCGMTVEPGATVDYTIEGLLTDAVQGLALFCVDLTVAGPTPIDLSTATTVYPGVDVDPWFVYPDGLNNPPGPGEDPDEFGGVPDEGGITLQQIGGGQNTINNDTSYAPAPIGAVQLGVGLTTATLATGSLLMPMDEGTYTITLSGGCANDIIGDSEEDVYPTGAIEYFTYEQCSITVEHLAFVIVGTEVCMDHAGYLGCNDLDAHNGIEPRAAGLTEVKFTVSGPPTTVDASVQCWGGTAPGVASVGIADTVVTVTFDATLPDEACCTVSLTGDVVDSFDVKRLIGDLNFNETTEVGDVDYVKNYVGQSLDATNFYCDQNINGIIEVGDGASIQNYVGNTAGVCE